MTYIWSRRLFSILHTLEHTTEGGNEQPVGAVSGDAVAEYNRRAALLSSECSA